MSAVTVTGQFTGIINFAIQRSHIPVIRSLTITNCSSGTLYQLRLEIAMTPPVMEHWEQRLPVLESGKSIEISPVPLAVKEEFLYSMEGRSEGLLQVKVYEGEETIYEWQDTLELLGPEEWSGILMMPELAAVYVMPYHPRIVGLAARATGFLYQWTDCPSFTGYRTRNPEAVRLELAAVYAALQEQNLACHIPQSGLDEVGQHIAMPVDVLDAKGGTPLELACLYASCLEAVGLHPLLIFMKSHVLAGCWLEDESFSVCETDEITALTKRMAEGITDITVVECLDFTAGRLVGFEQAQKHGKDWFSDPDNFLCAIDVAQCRRSGIQPLPERIREDGRIRLAEYEPQPEQLLLQKPVQAGFAENMPEEAAGPVSRQKVWERQLLDLSLRNTLLNFRMTRSTLQLLTADLYELEDSLAKEKEFLISERPEGLPSRFFSSWVLPIETEQDLVKAIASAELDAGRIRTFLPPQELKENLKILYRNARKSMEENGANTLYIALGFLRWYESEVSERARYAPLILVPVELSRKVRTGGYVVRMRQEEVRVNITLLEMLRQFYGISIPGMDPLLEDGNGIDLALVFRTVRRSVMEKSRWDVEEFAFLGLFSFSRFIMWNDIHSRSRELMRNKVVKSLLDGQMKWETREDIVSEEELDERIAPEEAAVPLSADSSQLAAIAAAAGGESFVLHGPPGTGKSQTIANMIANALGQGKTVLFVAEKMAALTVVQRRLEAIGLDPFCLELHSNKANKRSVLEKLERTLELGRIKHPEEYLRTAKQLGDLRRKLNEPVKALHKKRFLGNSLYEAVCRYEKRKNADRGLVFPSFLLTEGRKEDIQEWRESVIRYAAAAGEIGDIRKTPFLSYQGRSYSQELKDFLRQDLEEAGRQLSRLKEALHRFAAGYGFSDTLNRKELEAAAVLSEVIAEEGMLLGKIIDLGDISEVRSQTARLLELGKELNKQQVQLFQRFNPAIRDIDGKELFRQWERANESRFLSRIFQCGRLKKQLKKYALHPEVIRKETMESDCILLNQFSSCREALAAVPEKLYGLFPEIWAGEVTDWDKLERSLSRTFRLREALDGLEKKADRDQIQKIVQEGRESFSTDAESFQQEWKRITDLLDRLRQEYGILTDETELTGCCDGGKDWLKQLEKQFSGLKDGMNGLRDWVLFLQAEDELLSRGLSCVRDAFRKGGVASEELEMAWECSMYQACIRDGINEEPALACFQGAAQEALIRQFRDMTENFRQLTIQELAAKLSSSIPVHGIQSADSSELGILQKAIRSKGRMLSIRKLFDRAPTLLRRLCPCMLMSPISVAQYLDPSWPQFDLVIFDEASQLPTSEAVGAIARGKNCVVAGDPKQLPPTSFFASGRTDDEEQELEDGESLLEDCLALSMPEQYLQWHYRSGHESLIAYSNRRYYENRLYTFPSPDDRISRVKFVLTKGYYDKGRTKQNRAEAEAIAAEILRRLRTNPQDSIGVVTFSSAQQNLIEDLMEEAFSRDTELEVRNAALPEPVFIKNLENVQGDERDVILFSVGYGSDKNGKVSMNFGPLNKEGGWRRLNVAITRARKEMVVYSAILPEQIDLSRTRSEGVAGLKGFLEYARKGTQALPQRLGENRERIRILAREIAESLEERGYKTCCGVGCSSYQIDVAVLSDKEPDSYILGILLDGENDRETKTAGDRYLLQPGILEGMGWNIIRVWTMEWLEAPEKERDRICRCLEKLNMGIETDNIEEKSGRIPDWESVKEREHLHPYRRAYREAALEKQGSPDTFYRTENREAICRVILKLLKAEAPISWGMLKKKILSLWSISRSGNQVEQILEEACGSLPLPVTYGGKTKFLWNPGQDPEAYAVYRTGEREKRPIEDICPQEIANAVREVLEEQISLSYSDFIRETAGKFGYSRAGTVIEASVARGLALAEEKGRAETEDGEKENRVRLKA